MSSRHPCEFFSTHFFLQLGPQEKVPSAACHSPAHAKENHFAGVCASWVLDFFLLGSERKEGFGVLGGFVAIT